MKFVFAGILLALLLLGSAYPLMLWSGFLQATQEGIRTEVVEQSKAYRDGMRKELGRISLEYAAADATGKAAIRAHVLSAYAAEHVAEYPAHLQSFLSEMGL